MKCFPHKPEKPPPDELKLFYKFGPTKFSVISGDKTKIQIL